MAHNWLGLLILWGTFFNATGLRSVLFLLDSDSGISASDFNVTKSLIKDISDELLAENNTIDFRVGVSSYASGFNNDLNFVDSRTAMEALDSLSNTFKGNETNTANALRGALLTYFNEVRMDPHIWYIVLITNGGDTTTQLQNAIAEAAMFKNSLQFIYVVEIGNTGEQDQLKEIASDPDSEYFLQASSFADVPALTSVLADRLQAVNPVTPAPDIMATDPSSASSTMTAPWWLFLSSSISSLHILALKN